MNVLNEKENDKFLNVLFNQDNSCFSIGTETGFKIYQTYPFKGPYEKKMNGGIGSVEMLYKSNFLALLGGGKAPKFNNNKVVIWDDKENKVISELKFITPIIKIKLKKDLLFVICQKRIYLFNFNTYDIMETIDTGDNKKGLIAINNDPEFTVIAYPSTKDLSKVAIENFKLKKKLTITAQDDDVSYISLNYDGKILATANEKGTIIKVNICDEHGTLLKVFKRGIDKVEYIYICFDKETKFMAVSSNKGTIHIFSMGSAFKKLNEINKAKKQINKNEIDENKIIKKQNENLNKYKKSYKKYNKEKLKNYKNELEIEEQKENQKEMQKEVQSDEQKDKQKDEQKYNNIGEQKERQNENKKGYKIEQKGNKIEDNKEVQNENKKDNKNEEYKNTIYSQKENKNEEILPQNSKSYFGFLFSQIEKGFAKVKIKAEKNICTFIDYNKLIVISYDNKYYETLIDIDKGGVCKILEEKNLNNIFCL